METRIIEDSEQSLDELVVRARRDSVIGSITKPKRKIITNGLKLEFDPKAAALMRYFDEKIGFKANGTVRKANYASSVHTVYSANWLTAIAFLGLGEQDKGIKLAESVEKEIEENTSIVGENWEDMLSRSLYYYYVGEFDKSLELVESVEKKCGFFVSIEGNALLKADALTNSLYAAIQTFFDDGISVGIIHGINRYIGVDPETSLVFSDRNMKSDIRADANAAYVISHYANKLNSYGDFWIEAIEKSIGIEEFAPNMQRVKETNVTAKTQALMAIAYMARKWK
jgi:hypothetical protein